MAPKSPHKPLDSTTQEIRLLTFDITQKAPPESNSGSPIISLFLSHVPLSAPSSSAPLPPFQALSCVWGIPDPDEPLPTILLDGVPMTVTPNLHSALCFLLSQQQQPEDNDFKTSFWIVQEVVLARKAVVACGSGEGVVVDWEDVRDALQLFEWMILYSNIDPKYRRLYALLGDIMPSVMHLEEATNACRLSLRKGKDGMRLMEVLLFTDCAVGEDKAIQATGPRDRIYGLLGLVRESDRKKIPVIYSDKTTVSTVLTHVATALIQEYGPDVLCYHRETARWADEGLPSWVPDWAAPRSPTIGSVNLDRPGGVLDFDATKGTHWPSNSTVETAVNGESKLALFLPGAVMSTVVRIGSEFTSVPGQENYRRNSGPPTRLG
ncbi:hypothetical protein N0V85_008573 [Neurospora sp. IMI 360204]|nr:hypothetical protein N0V85_008573 [Neurospora sp. IMI 360204]